MENPHKLRLLVLKDNFAIHLLEIIDKIPEELFQEKYYWIGKTDAELSIICRSDLKINSQKKDEGWSAIKLNEVFDFSLIGIIAEISRILAEAKISIFVISTYDTDYVLIKKDKLSNAIEVLMQSGYSCEYE